MEKLISIAQLARILNRHRTRIYVYQKTGYLPPAVMRNGRTIGWRESDILDWMEKNKDVQAN
ncbi:TPA: helix-turn-helix domain-containing protein [Enterobacter asburiae]|uniref:helix-turn-helix transcriptional regulator n=1 Tax=Enterobacter roggenkampii TaxID=1812935 RepID=UPI0032AFDD14|nr:helix-turn-helix domain-containing protein [Enterobacter asburiae]HDR2774508.1 helix-turn-helix domain-containing protein [Enterobacter asburiae]